MNTALVREQLRAGRKSLITASALIAGTMGLASFAVLLLTTQSAIGGGGYTFKGSVKIADTTEYGAVSATALNAMVADIEAAGDDATAGIDFDVDISTPGEEAWGNTTNLRIEALGGSPDWDSLLVGGEAPGAGEVVLRQIVADALDVGIGDSVVLAPSNAAVEPNSSESWEFEVSGISRGNTQGALEQWVPDAYTDWDGWQALTVAHQSTPPQASFQWNPPSATLDSYTDWVNYSEANNLAGLSGTFAIAALLAIAIGVATLAAAFALGRAQAQSRVQWVATARALGASRASVTRAALVEWALLTVTGGVAGVLLGYLGVVTVLAVQRAGAELPGLPTLPVVPTGWGLGLLAFGALLAGVVALIPALWSRTVEPAEAFKDSSPITERSGRHTVGNVILVSGFAVAVWVQHRSMTEYFATNGLWDDTAWTYWARPWTNAALSVVIFLLAIAIAARSLRAALRTLGRRLSRSGSATLASAGDVLASRAAGTAGLIVAPWAAVAAVIFNFNTVEFQGFSALRAHALLSAATLAVMLVVAHVASAASLGGASGDWKTRRALGLSLLDARRAAGVVHGISITAGVVLGSAAGAVVWFLVLGSVPGSGAPTAAFLYAIAVILIALPCIVAAGAIFAAAASRIVGGKERAAKTEERALAT